MFRSLMKDFDLVRSPLKISGAFPFKLPLPCSVVVSGSFVAPTGAPPILIWGVGSGWFCVIVDNPCARKSPKFGATASTKFFGFFGWALGQYPVPSSFSGIFPEAFVL